MTRSKQTGRRQRGNANRENKRKKRRKAEKRFWIEDCPDTATPEDTSDAVVFDVMITRVILSDNYNQVSQASRATESSETCEQVIEARIEAKPEVASEGDNQEILITKQRSEIEDSNVDQPRQKDPLRTSIDSAIVQNPISNEDDLQDNGDAAKDAITEPPDGLTRDEPREEDKPIVRPLIVIKRTPSAKGGLRHVSPYPFN